MAHGAGALALGRGARLERRGRLAQARQALLAARRQVEEASSALGGQGYPSRSCRSFRTAAASAAPPVSRMAAPTSTPSSFLSPAR